MLLDEGLTQVHILAEVLHLYSIFQHNWSIVWLADSTDNSFRHFSCKNTEHFFMDWTSHILDYVSWISS